MSARFIKSTVLLAIAAWGVAGASSCASEPATVRLQDSALRLKWTRATDGWRLSEATIRTGRDRSIGVARIEKDTVMVASPEVKAPVAARYAWDFNPDCNLFNAAGLPASPFRTDTPTN